MNWLEVLKDIHRNLETNGFSNISKEIENEQLKGGTGSEIFTLVSTKLISIKKDHPEIYAVIKEETDWMIAYGKTMNYL